MIELMIEIRPFLVPLMLAIFTAIVLWAYSPSRRARLDECGRIPLGDDR
jgi:cbb3-type cytochrome oxidase subunit 3